MINAEQLNAIKERAAKATPGPWYHNRHNEISTPNGARLAQTVTGLDAEFIAHAREDVPALVAEVERLEEVAVARFHLSLGWERIVSEKDVEIERLRKALEYYADLCKYNYADAMKLAGTSVITRDAGQTAREALAFGEESNAL